MNGSGRRAHTLACEACVLACALPLNATMLRKPTITIVAAALINWVLIALLGADTRRTRESPDHDGTESTDSASASEPRAELSPVIEPARPSSKQRASAPQLAQPRDEHA